MTRKCFEDLRPKSAHAKQLTQRNQFVLVLADITKGLIGKTAKRR
jgi:hypothetical protein